MTSSETIRCILNNGNAQELRTLFSFTIEEPIERIVMKFNLWSRYFFIKYFSSPDASFHREMDAYLVKLYKADIDSFLNIVFRGGAKTTRTKLFLAYCIANDLNHSRRFLKILSRDTKNSRQFVTDVYNMLVIPRVRALYPEIFQKTVTKREESMDAFTTATGVKLASGTVGSSQRGQIQDDARPDFIVFDDFEDRATLRSAVITKALWDNMEEARTGLSKNGASLYLCNYISERGNVHKLVEKVPHKMIVPIIENGIPTWDRYSKEEIQTIQNNADDFEGEYLCKPSASKDVLFDRETVDAQKILEPIKEIAGLRIYKNYDPSHRIAGGADVAGGVGLDSSASVYIDFDTVPAQVVATFDSNEIKPDVFGDELARQGERFGECLLAPENNKFDMCIGRLKQIYPTDKIYKTERADTKVQSGKLVTYGWNTNGLTKSKMLFALSKAVDDGLLSLNCPNLIAEARSYTRDDLMDSEIDPRLTTRHFDLLVACAIAWQMKDQATVNKNKDEEYRIAQNRIIRRHNDAGV